VIALVAGAASNLNPTTALPLVSAMNGIDAAFTTAAWHQRWGRSGDGPPGYLPPTAGAEQ